MGLANSAEQPTDCHMAAAPQDKSCDNKHIPSRLFQTWKTKHCIPDNFKRWSDSFLVKNPAFHYELWDDQDNREFIKREFLWFLALYDSYPAEIYRVDAVRYFYLYLFGGVYADMDTECLKPLDDMLGIADVILGQMGLDSSFPHSIPNAIMASKPRQEFWLVVLYLLMRRAHWKARPECITGPMLLKDAVYVYCEKQSRDICTESMLRTTAVAAVKQKLTANQQPESAASKIEILQSNKWYPIDWSNAEQQSLRLEVLRGNVLDEYKKAVLFPDSWMVTYWAHSWNIE